MLGRALLGALLEMQRADAEKLAIAADQRRAAPIGMRRRGEKRIVDEIFPESELPRLADIARAAEMELEIERVRNDRGDYVKTLRAWLGRIKERRDDAIAASSEETVARYERYLRMFAYSMELGAFTLLRLTMRRIDLPGRW